MNPRKSLMDMTTAEFDRDVAQFVRQEAAKQMRARGDAETQAYLAKIRAGGFTPKEPKTQEPTEND
jgi:hypothetical protein